MLCYSNPSFVSGSLLIERVKRLGELLGMNIAIHVVGGVPRGQIRSRPQQKGGPIHHTIVGTYGGTLVDCSAPWSDKKCSQPSNSGPHKWFLVLFTLQRKDHLIDDVVVRKQRQVIGCPQC